MRFLADANVEAMIVSWLRSQNCDVLSAAEMPTVLADSDLLQLALNEERLLLTNDLDFGMLVFRRALASKGVVLLRLESPLQSERLAVFQSHWWAIKANCAGNFIVVSEKRFRVRPMP